MQDLRDATGVDKITDDDLAMWHSVVPNDSYAVALTQTRMQINWCEELAPQDPETQRGVQLCRRAILDRLKSWAAIHGVAAERSVAVLTRHQGDPDAADWGAYTPGLAAPGREAVAVINGTGNGHKRPGLFRRIAGVGRS